MKKVGINMPSTIQELASFRNILNEKDKLEAPLLKRVEKPMRLIYHLSVQFSK